MDITHLTALQTRLAHEHEYLAAAKSESEIALRKVWIAQVEREIAAEKVFLGLEEIAADEMSVEDLLAELMA